MTTEDVYLGVALSSDGKLKAELHARIASVGTVLGQFQHRFSEEKLLQMPSYL